MNDRDIPNIADIIGNAFDQERPLQDTAADLGATILEIDRERQYQGEHTRRMAELKKMAELQEKVVHQMLDRSIDGSNQPKILHLTVVK
jgi:hypothetical protein